MDGDGDAPRLAPAHDSVTEETLFAEWEQYVKAADALGLRSVSAWDYVYDRRAEIGKSNNDQAERTGAGGNRES